MTETPPERPDPDKAPTPGETAQPILDEGIQQAAVQDEQAALDEAVRQAAHLHLQQRAVTLNVEVRIRDEKIAALEAENAELREALEGAQASLNVSDDPAP